MITLHLNHGTSHEGVYLKLPATPGEVGEAYALLETLGSGPVAIFDATCAVRNLDQYVRNVVLDSDRKLDTLQHIALNMEEMSPNERKVFAVALDSESINGLDDVLKVSNNLDQYLMIHGVTNDRELGQFLVESGYGNFPERVRPYLNYAAIGTEYHAERGGAYTADGYVLRKQSVQEQNEKDGAVFRLFLQTSDYRTLQLSLPALDEELDRAKEILEIDDFAQCSIERIDCIPYLAELIPNECITVEAANDLACGIDDLHQRDGELMKYLSALEVEQPENFIQAYHLMLNLDDYERVPNSAEEYGKMVLIRHGADDEVINALEGYTNFEQLGEDAMIEDGVRKTEFGLVRRLSYPFPEETQSMQMGGM